MKLTIVGNTYTIDKRLLEKVAQTTFSYLDAEKLPGNIELKFVSSKIIHELNMTYRGVDRPTDVLSFNVDDDPLAGQIVICYTYTIAEAKKRERDIDSEFALLLVHGILHIFGYDHATLDEEQKMQIIERKILNMEGMTR